MSYSLTTKTDNGFAITIANQPYRVNLNTTPYKVTLSQSGDQGPPGVGVANIAIVNHRLIATMTDGSEIDAGPVPDGSLIKDVAYSASLTDIETGSLTVGTLQGGTY